jgi:hypothetical protein
MLRNEFEGADRGARERSAKRVVCAAFLAVLAGAPGGLAAQQTVKPPIASYWMSVETAAGTALPGVAGIGGAIPGRTGAGTGGGRTMLLQLGSQRRADSPRAEHFVPSGLDMGVSLPLHTPQRSASPERAERAMPEDFEQPKGRMLVYWGCGEKARPGQPLVVDFSGLARGQAPAGLVSRRVSAASPPAPGRAATYGEWPHPLDARPVPANASLKGVHRVQGNYSPDIEFALGEGLDFMDRVELAAAPGPEGAVRVRWNRVETATGYFATAFGAVGEDAVFWSSSEVQETGGMLMDFAPPAEVARLIRERVVLPPSVTECTVPAEVVKRAGGAALFRFVAYGPEANFAHPPRPKDPRQPWEPQWAVKVRFKSTASTLLGGSLGEPDRPAEAPREAPASRPAPAAPDPVREGIEILRGIFGR